MLPTAFPWRDRIHCFDTVDSTNTLAKSMAREGAPHGTVILAKAQTAGRGRLGRCFSSPENQGLYLSMILRYPQTGTELMHLTCAAGIAMCDAVEITAGFRPQIKWINDLVKDGKKLGGILTELSFSPAGKLDFAVVGIGINCGKEIVSFPEEIQGFVGTVNQFSQENICIPHLAANAILALHEMDKHLLSNKQAIMDRYRENCITLGKEICVVKNGNARHGTALDIDDDGALTVLYTNGEKEAVNAGEVSIRGMYGYI